MSWLSRLAERQIQKARLKEKDDTQDFASIQSFTAVVDFRTKEISALRLEKPSIRIVQQADGSFNFSDLISAPPSETGPAKGSPSAMPGETAPSSPAPAAPAPATPAPTFAIRMVDIEDAHFEFVRMDAENHAETFTLSNLCLQVHNFSPDQPFQLAGHVTIGKTSVFQFEGSGPALAEYAGNPTNNVTPQFIGKNCFDTANQAFYVATGLTSADWKKLTP